MVGFMMADKYEVKTSFVLVAYNYLSHFNSYSRGFTDVLKFKTDKSVNM